MATKLTISGTSPATASTAVLGLVLKGLSKYSHLYVVADLVGATGGVLDVYLQTSHDGTRWNDYAHFAQLTAGAAAITKTFAVSRTGQQLTIATIGSGTSPALAVNTVVGGEFGDQMRMLCVAGASTSAGAALAVYIDATRLN